MTLEHVGIAIADPAHAALFERLFAAAPYKAEVVEREGVQTLFFGDGGEAHAAPKMELLEAIREDSPIATYVSKRGPGLHHLGELQAWDLDTGERVWTREFKSHNWGPVLTTGGRLVFMGGTNDRYFRAFDAATGDLLWEQRTNSGVTGVPSSYAVDGVQYIAVQSGYGVDAQGMQGVVNRSRGTNVQVPQGGVIWVFALRE